MSKTLQIIQQHGDSMKPALLRGARLRCPRCGEGRMFSSYLKVAPQCGCCGLDLTPQRADDGPAYVVILIVAHLIGFSLPVMFDLLGDRPTMIAVVLGMASVVLSLAMLPPVKGMFVALQWFKGMHGFRAEAAPVAKA
ncbi:DUF983 domain-containing protein [Paracoccus benzoatiresistens]|uniref:DUF983 domain-containing protein n=1 Tax=Paracoccus benzoatiresistens TaxID=2997341 RepID=A0ABT4J0L6_9RHOB|nr:DUF983 domain-containing protein [Paracoccus sp. EF6]MCZ0960659.1 DUF983 domain-containing protein [Paracoccus sp. EF6]